MTTASRRLAPAALAGLLALSLAACTTGSQSGGATGSGGAEEGAYPVTITHAYGETTIESEPLRVVTVGWSDQDIVIALGVVPVGCESITASGTADGSTAWFDEALAALGGTAPARFNDDDGLAVDEIAALNPDIIIGTQSGMTQDEYDRLSQLAPTIAYPGDPWLTSWEDSLDMVGAALGRPAAAAALKADVLAQVAQAKVDYPTIQGRTFIFAYLMPSDLSIISYYTTNSSQPQFLESIGMVSAPIIDELSEPGAYYGTVSAEQATTLVSDIFITYAFSESDHDLFANDPLIGQIPAIAAGHLLASPDDKLAFSLAAPSPLSIPYAINYYVPLIVETLA